MLSADETDIRQLYCRRRHVGTGAGAAAQGRLASLGAGATESRGRPVLWATGYRLDFSILDIPVLDERNYPRHHRGVTEHPGLYAVGLPWPTAHGSSIAARRGPGYRVHCPAHRTEHRRPVKATYKRVATRRKARRSARVP